MYVKTTDAEAFAELQKSFGVGTSGPDSTTEYFGLYHAEHCGGFWSCDPRRQVWRRHECEDPGWMESVDIERFADIFFWARHIARPEMPDDLAVAKRSEPFLYSGYIFQWIFTPELVRWELLPIGKHDAAPTASQH